MTSGQKFTKLPLPNAGGIAVKNVLVRFWISSSVLEIFAAELLSCQKSLPTLYFFLDYDLLQGLV